MRSSEMRPEGVRHWTNSQVFGMFMAGLIFGMILAPLIRAVLTGMALR